jgi:hypothetical protein
LAEAAQIRSHDAGGIAESSSVRLPERVIVGKAMDAEQRGAVAGLDMVQEGSVRGHRGAPKAREGDGSPIKVTRGPIQMDEAPI